jgi:hypothetical protein
MAANDHKRSGEGVNNMREFTITDLEAETVELLPARETLFIHFGHNWAAVYASNSSTALNVNTFLSSAHSTALQSINVQQG